MPRGPRVTLMLDGKALYALIASVVVRVPNLVLPIIAVRAFNFSEYSIFAVAFVTASAMSAFLGEAIAVTISRESYRARLGVQGAASLAAFFRVAILVSYSAIVAGLCLYWLFFAASGGDDGWLLAVGTILLVPAYMLPVATTALATASGHGNSSVVAALVGIPISIALSLLVGATFGVAYFFATYFACVVLTNLYVYIKVASASSARSLHGAWKTLWEFGPVFIAILAPFFLGGPVHGFCLSILGRQESGVAELAEFVAYYPWSLVVSAFAGFLTNYVIQLIVAIGRENDVPRLRRFLIRLLLGNVAVSVLMGVCLWHGKDFVFALYGPNFAMNQGLIGWMLVCGVSAACVSTTSQIVIGTGKGKGLLKCAVLHALLYSGLTYFFVEGLSQGATGLIRALTFSQTTLALSHMVLICFSAMQRQKKGIR